MNSYKNTAQWWLKKALPALLNIKLTPFSMNMSLSRIQKIHSYRGHDQQTTSLQIVVVEIAVKFSPSPFELCLLQNHSVANSHTFVLK